MLYNSQAVVQTSYFRKNTSYSVNKIDKEFIVESVDIPSVILNPRGLPWKLVF